MRADTSVANLCTALSPELCTKKHRFSYASAKFSRQALFRHPKRGCPRLGSLFVRMADHAQRLESMATVDGMIKVKAGVSKSVGLGEWGL